MASAANWATTSSSPLMSSYFADNTTQDRDRAELPRQGRRAFEFTEPADGPAYAVSDIGRRLGTAVLVYGTQREAGANRYAAEQLQAQYLNQFESQVPIYKDFEVTDDLLAHKDVIFVGRPEANTALAAWAKQINLDYQGAIFKIENQTHAGEREALTLGREESAGSVPHGAGPGRQRRPAHGETRHRRQQPLRADALRHHRRISRRRPGLTCRPRRAR